MRPISASRCATRLRPILVVVLFVASGCADAITAPPALDPSTADRVMPAVTDARSRLAAGIENAGVRQRVEFDLQQLENALASRDGQKARYHLQLVAGILADYRASLGSLMRDGPDVSGIALSLVAASGAVGAAVDLETLR